MNPNLHTKFEINKLNSFLVIAHIMIVEEGKSRKLLSAMATFLVTYFRKFHISETAPMWFKVKSDITKIFAAYGFPKVD